MTHWIAAGSTPARSSHTPVSIAVLPAPRMTKRRGVRPWPRSCHRPGKPFGGSSQAPGKAVCT